MPVRVFCSGQTAKRPSAVEPPEDQSEDEGVEYHAQSYDCVEDYRLKWATEGSKILQRIKIHSLSYHIFRGNNKELKRILEKYHDSNFAVELWAMHNRPKLDLF